MNGRVVGAPRREGTESCGQTTVMEDGNLVGVVDGPAGDQATCTTDRAASSEPDSPSPWWTRAVWPCHGKSQQAWDLGREISGHTAYLCNRRWYWRVIFF